MHGIAAVGIIGFILVLAVLGRAAMVGNGPFAGSVDGVIGATDGLSITLTVTNKGSRDTATICEIDQSPARPGTPTQVIQTPLMRAGQTVTFTTVVTKFGTVPLALSANCQSS
jgi:hypothetical protein